jgi:hypothetical protein
MEDAMKERLTSRDLWMRALFMILFVIAYGVAELLVTLTVIFQFFTILFTGSANETLLRFGKNLSTYIRQIISFETFNSEDRPWPISDWPDEDLDENRWMGPPPAAPPAAAPPPPPSATAPVQPEAPEPPEPPEPPATTRSDPSESAGEADSDLDGTTTSTGSDEDPDREPPRS